MIKLSNGQSLKKWLIENSKDCNSWKEPILNSSFVAATLPALILPVLSQADALDLAKWFGHQTYCSEGDSGGNFISLDEMLTYLPKQIKKYHDLSTH